MTDDITTSSGGPTPPPIPSGPEVADASTGSEAVIEDEFPKEISLDDLTPPEEGEEVPANYVRIATPVGYSLTIREDLPVIDSDGIDVPPEVAEAIIAISDDIDGKVFRVETEED